MKAPASERVKGCERSQAVSAGDCVRVDTGARYPPRLLAARPSDQRRYPAAAVRRTRRKPLWHAVLWLKMEPVYPCRGGSRYRPTQTVCSRICRVNKESQSSIHLDHIASCGVALTKRRQSGCWSLGRTTSRPVQGFMPSEESCQHNAESFVGGGPRPSYLQGAVLKE